jgi:hypothetical protein
MMSEICEVNVGSTKKILQVKTMVLIVTQKQILQDSQYSYASNACGQTHHDSNISALCSLGI